MKPYLTFFSEHGRDEPYIPQEVRKGKPPIILSYINKGLAVYTTFTTDDIVLECEVDGHPPAIINWYKDAGKGKQKITDSRYIHSRDGLTSRLTIKSAEIEDSGNYIVKAKNKHGKAWTNCEVMIYGK